MDAKHVNVTDLPLAERLRAGGYDTLWIHGDPSAMASPLVAVIGTRDADPAGVATTRRLAIELARAGVGVLSGGALGVDAAAHEGALMASGRTVVVLPAGFNHWYPKRHTGLYRAVVESGGVLVSQFSPETPPTRWTFPKRNVLLATLADIVVVVQAPAASGALIAAEEARRLGRRVMAVPSHPGDRRGEGCLLLLRTGAPACVCARDVLDLLGRPDGALFLPGVSPPARVRAPVRKAAVRASGLAAAPAVQSPGSMATLDADDRLVYDSLAITPRHVDEIARLAGLPAARVQQGLLTLVLAGIIEDRGAGMFVLARG